MNNKQLNLFDQFVVEDENNQWTQSIELFDAMPKFYYHRVSKRKEPLIVKREFTHRGKHYFIDLIPGIIEDKDGSAWAATNGKREELVMHALRYMAVQKQIETEEGDLITDKESSFNKIPSVALKFTIHELRKELQRMGHGYKWSEINEALDILSSAVIKIDDGKYWSKGSILSHSMGAKDDEGSRCVVFHPLASQAILSKSTRLLRYDKYMSISKPLARWIYMRLCHLITNARERKLISKGIGLKISYEQIYEESGQQELKQKSANYRTIREALKELYEKGHIGNKSMNDLGYESDNNEYWTIYPSNSTVSDIMDANKANPRSHENLNLEQK